MTDALNGYKLVIVEIPAAVYFQILENARFRIDVNAERPVKTHRCHIDRHLPTVHITGNGHSERLQFLSAYIIISIGAKIPFRGKAEAIIKRNVRC